MHKQYTRGAIWVLILLGFSVLIARYVNTDPDHIPTGDSAWMVEINVRFNAREPGTAVRISPPYDTSRSRLYAQQLTHPGLRLERVKKQDTNRDIVAITTRKGPVRFQAEFNIHASAIAYTRSSPGSGKLSAEQRQKYLDPLVSSDLEQSELHKLLKKLTVDNPDKDELLQRIFRHVNHKLVHDPRGVSEDVNVILKKRRGNDLGLARTMVALCRAAALPARVVSGFVLREETDVTPNFWVQVHDGEKWQPYSPTFGFAGELPPAYLPMRYDDGLLVRINDTVDYDVDIDIAEIDVPYGMLSGEQRNVFDIIDLTRLPLVTKTALALLMMLPFGALITAIGRNVAGVRTFGTFTPTLIALSAVYVDWLTALVVFLVVGVIGYSGRSLLPGFKLARVPRLTIVFTLVAMSMTLAISIMDYYNLNPSGHIVLLPIVVLTSLIDRVYSVIDEDGKRVALIRLLWTFVIAFFCFLLFQDETLGFRVLGYPELHFFTLAGILLVAQYQGPQLCDLEYCKWLKEPKKKRSDKNKRVTKTPDEEPGV